MKTIKLLFVSLGLAAFALAQGPAGPNVSLRSGTVAATSLVCNDASVGSVYTVSTAAGLTNICQQTSAGVYAWVPLQNSSTSGGGTLVVASGKTATISNSLTFAGTDGVTETFPSTSATIARTDAANTFTGVQTLSSAPVLSTSTLTSGAGTITFPTASITVPGTIFTECGASNSCASPSTQSSVMKVAHGIVAFSAATTASVTGITPAFTATTSYTCSIYNPSHNYTWNFTTQTTTGFTLTAGTSNSDSWSWTCVGY